MLQPCRNWALFLDLDGTLIDIAPCPDKVVVPDDLVPALYKVSHPLGGALAIVSGRPLHEVDSLLTPLKLPIGAEHGAVVRFPGGRLDTLNTQLPAKWLETLGWKTGSMPGVLLEVKHHSVVAHYRQAPEREADLFKLANELVATAPDQFEVLPCRMAVEIRARAATKARAVALLMKEPPFAGRIPVYIGDDVTDEDGFKAARERGGLGIHVGARFDGQPSEVREWLARFDTLKTAGAHADA